MQIGNIAPNFTLGSNRASRVSLSGLRGKVVILNFWATWCPPCQHEVPALQAVHNEYGPQGVVVLAVNEGEKIETVERFANDHGISFAVWLDEDGWAGHLYNVRAIPTTYFIDREGIIRAVHFGSMTQEQIVTQLKKLL
ncbi:MAG: TlpA family protein disulfide reductase [Caldilineae bacterium]|nr:MAG: TlpA family protein disulfide reductase [Caldilineae bacterium]